MPVRFAEEKLEENVKRTYHNIILASFKAVQMILGITSLVDHVVMTYTQYQSSPHVVIFCGTYFGFSVISAGLLYEYLIGDRNPNHLEIFFCAIGGILCSICNNLTMYIAKENTYIHKSKYDPLRVDQSYFELARVQSVVSMVTGVSYYVDLFINLDIWLSTKRKMKRKEETEDVLHSNTLIITVVKGRDDGTEEEEQELRSESEIDILVTNLFIKPEDELQLHAFCFELKGWLKSFKENFKNIFKRRKIKVTKPVTELDFHEFLSLVEAYHETLHEGNIEVLSIAESKIEESDNSEQDPTQEDQSEPPKVSQREDIRKIN